MTGQRKPVWVHILQCSPIWQEAYHSFSKSTHPHFWSYRVKVYLNEPSPWNKFCMGNQSTLLECWEAQRQVLCISEVGKLCVTLLRVTLHCSWLMGPHKLATPCSRWYFTIQSVLWCQNVSFQGWWLCCMLLLSNTSANFSGNESLKAHRRGHSFVVKCRTHKRAPTPLFGRLARWSAHGYSLVRLRYMQNTYLP